MALKTTVTVGPGNEMTTTVEVAESASAPAKTDPPKTHVLLTYDPLILEYVPCSARPTQDELNEPGGLVAWYDREYAGPCEGVFEVTLRLRPGASLGTTVSGFAVESTGASKDLDTDFKT